VSVLDRGSMVMSPISTSSGCSIAKATARATASGAMPISAIPVLGLFPNVRIVNVVDELGTDEAG